MWRVCKEAGRPWPTLDSDDVIDYFIAEAVAIRVGGEDRAQEKKREIDRWKEETTKKLEEYR